MDKFEEQLLSVLNLLYKKYLLEMPENSNEKSVHVSIYPRDIQDYQISVDTLWEIVSFLNKKEPRIKLLNLLDVDDFLAEELSENNPSIYDIELPSDFKDKYRELRNFYSKNTLGKDGAKITISVSPVHGIYKNKDTSLSYAIKGKRLKIVISLASGKIVGSKLAELYYDNSIPRLSSEIKKINKNFIEKLNLSKSLIIRLKTAGYDLNNEEYEIEFLNFNN